MISSNCTSSTPSCSISEVKTPCIERQSLSSCFMVALTSSDSIVLQPPAEASSAMVTSRMQAFGGGSSADEGTEVLLVENTILYERHYVMLTETGIHDSPAPRDASNAIA